LFLETKIRVVSLAVKLVDDLSSNIITNGNVLLSSIGGNDRVHAAIKKQDGFYVLTDVPDWAYKLSIKAQSYQSFEHNLTMPLPVTDKSVLNIPGQNELLLSVQSSDTSTETVSFANRHFYHPIVAGTQVISSRRLGALATTLEGESVGEATLDEVGSGASRIRTNDIIRFIGERVIRLKPAPHYAFGKQLRRLIGSVRDAATDQAIPNAQVEITRVNSHNINAEDVGTTANNTVSIYSIQNGVNKRVIGTSNDIQRIVDSRGRFVLYFPERLDLDIDNITLSVTAANYAAISPLDIDLTTQMETVQTIHLTRM